jgi:integrase/recombinase XerC
LAKYGPNTRAAYDADLKYFARYRDRSPQAAVADLLENGAHHANFTVLEYSTHMTGLKLAPATIGRRLCAIRSMVRLANLLGRISWVIAIQSPKVQKYRDTAGPGREGWERMKAAAAERTDAKGVRDYAILRLLHDWGLRRSEPLSLDLAHVDFEVGRPVAIRIKGKGRADRERLELPPQTAAALEAWIGIRGTEPGPLFGRLDHPERGGRLTGRAIHQITRKIGERAGLVRGTHPHGLRHRAITEALDRTGGDVRRVQRFSRHALVEIVMRYDDARTNPADNIARLVAGD